MLKLCGQFRCKKQSDYTADVFNTFRSKNKLTNSLLRPNSFHTYTHTHTRRGLFMSIQHLGQINQDNDKD